MRRLIIIVVPALVVGFLSVPAAATPGPPEYESSDPPPGKKTHTKTTEVSVTFNEILDPSTAELSVSACGETVDDGRPPTVTMETISIGIGENPVGTYTVVYKVSGADDTPQEKAAPTEGSYAFSYHSTQCGGSEPGDGPDGEHGHHEGGHDNGSGDHGHHRGKNGGTEHGGHGQDGQGGGSHASTSHTDHSAERGNEHSEDHSGDHSARSHEGGHQKKGNGGHHSGSGKNGHHGFGGHNGKSHTDDPGNAGGNKSTAGPKPSKTSDVVNLLLVLLIPAAMGALGGRMLRKAGIRPAH